MISVKLSNFTGVLIVWVPIALIVATLVLLLMCRVSAGVPWLIV